LAQRVRDGQDIWTKLHRWSGLATMVFLFVAAVTGCILVFAEPLDRALNPDLFESASKQAPSPVAAVTAFQRQHPELRVRSFPLNVPAGDTIQLAIGSAPGQPKPEFDQLFLDGVTGKVAGSRATAPGWDRRHLVEGIEELHFNLLAGTPGRWVLGVVAVFWLLSNFIGVYLTWPKKPPYWKSWKRMWRVSLRSQLPRFLLDLHRASGLWLLPVLTVLAFTSVGLSFYGEFYEPTVTRISPLKHTLFDQPAPYPQGASPTLGFGDAVRLAQEQARQEKQAWQPATALYNPGYNIYGVTFTNNGALNYRDLGPVYLYFDAVTGRLVHRVDPYSDTAGLVMIRMLYPLHSGKVAGWPTVTLIFLGGLSTAAMAITGVYIWWKKRKARLRVKVVPARQ
jgi:uncharacterized iron-regulated membrane protein